MGGQAQAGLHCMHDAIPGIAFALSVLEYESWMPDWEKGGERGCLWVGPDGQRVQSFSSLVGFTAFFKLPIDLWRDLEMSISHVISQHREAGGGVGPE